MKLNSMDKIDETGNNNIQYYFFAVLGGVFVGIFLKFIIKALTAIIQLIIANWMWAVGITLGILVFFKIMRKKK